MNFVHPLRSPRAPAEGSMERSLLRASLHQQGAEPKRPLCGIQRGGSVVNKGAWQAAAQPGDYCEPDRAQRDSPLRRLHRLPP